MAGNDRLKRYLDQEHDRVIAMLVVGDVLKAVIYMFDKGIISRPERRGAEA